MFTALIHLIEAATENGSSLNGDSDTADSPLPLPGFQNSRRSCKRDGLCWVPNSGMSSDTASEFLAIPRPHARSPSIVVVGSSGNLLGLALGKRIDAHDLIVRVNNAPTSGRERTVGSRTHVRVAHPGAVVFREREGFSYRWTRNASISNAANVKHSVSSGDQPLLLLLLRAQISNGQEWEEARWPMRLDALESAAAPTRVRRLSYDWINHTFESHNNITASTGMLAVGVAIELARLWGGSPPLVVGFGPSACHKYYKCNITSERQDVAFHNFTDEMDLLLSLSLARRIDGRFLTPPGLGMRLQRAPRRSGSSNIPSIFFRSISRRSAIL